MAAVASKEEEEELFRSDRFVRPSMVEARTGELPRSNGFERRPRALASANGSTVSAADLLCTLMTERAEAAEVRAEAAEVQI